MSTYFSEVFLLQPAPLERRLHRRVDDRRAQEQELDVVRIAADRGSVAAHLLAILLHLLDVAAFRDDGVGPLRRELLARRRAAGLHDRHSSLRRAWRIDRPAHLEVLALVVDGMDLAAVGEHRLVAIQHHGIGFPRLPQPGDDVGELVGHLVALVVRPVLVVAVVLRGAIVAAGDAVPADAALGDMVQRIDETRQQVRRVFRHGERRHEAKVLRGLRQPGHEDRRVELGAALSILQIGVVVALVGIGHVRGVLDDHVIHARTLHPLGKVDEDVGHHPARDVGDTAGPRRAPGLGSETLAEKPGEMKWFAHAWLLQNPCQETR